MKLAYPSQFLLARSLASYKECLDSHTLDSLQAIVDQGGQLILSTNHLSGYILTPDHTIQSLFNIGHKGEGKTAALDAIQRGASSLTVFNRPKLVKFYQNLGFAEISRQTFDPAQAPNNWETTLPDKPDVLTMAIR